MTFQQIHLAYSNSPPICPEQAQQLDSDIGAGFLLRHFSRWLVVLTTGAVDALIIDDIVLDNVAVTTIDNISGSICRNISLLQTVMWKNASRQLQLVSQEPTKDPSSRVFPNTETGLNGRVLKAAVLPVGSSTLPHSVSNRTLLAFWWLCCIPITAVYSGNLVAFLTVTKDNVPFTGLDDLLDSGYDIGIETGSYVAEIFSGSNDSVKKQIWKKNREHQPDNLTSEEDIMYHRTRLAEGRLMVLVERGVIDKWYELPNLDEKVCSSKEGENNGLKLRDLFTVLFVAGCGVGLAAFVLVFEISCGFLGYSQAVSDTGNISSFFCEMDMLPTAIIIGPKTDSLIDDITRTISRQGKTVILDLDAFTSTISSHMSTVMLHENLASVTRNLKFLVLSDIETIRPLLQKAQQLDSDIGAGLLLRHFSRWLVVLTTGTVDALIIDDIVLDNVAVTTINNISGSICRNISLLQTMMWKNASRKLQPVSQVPTKDLSSRIFPNTKTGLNGRLLKAAALQWFSCKLNNKTKTISGPCSRLISHLSGVFNFSYTYVEPEDQSWGKYDNGTWDGIMGLLLNKTVDISAVPYAVSLRRSNYVTFLYPIRYTYKDILYKKPDSRVDWAVLLSCFKWQVNVCVLVTIVAVTTSFLVCKRCSAHQHGRSKQVDHQMLETIMSTIGVTCKQGPSTPPNTESNRILLAFWWLCCIPITAVYSGNLVAFLTVTKDNVPFTGLNDLLDSGYGIGIETGSYVAEIFSGSNDSVNKQIWEKNREHQPDNLTNEEDIVYHRIRLAEGRYAFITDSDIINSYMADKCDMAHTMEQRLMFLVERGIIDKWYEQSNLDEKVCSSKEEEDNGLKLRNLFTVLLVAGCGVGLAAVVLVFEICKYKKVSHRKRAQEGKGL
ncbi:uncharacterized protein [Haliotis cracherodii]|uniref:uncharacterized protein n=1 Tax=Haliotis cracherodii TaxID=6455 RepID=UPI0039E7D0C2